MLRHDRYACFALTAALWGIAPSPTVAQPAAPPDPGTAPAFVAPRPQAHDLRVGRAIGLPVDDRYGMDFGVVVDVVVDAVHGVVRYLAVRGGGPSDRVIAVPLGEMRVATSDRGVVHTPLPDTRIRLGADASGLPGAPGFVEGPVRGGRPDPAEPDAMRLRGSRMLRATVVAPDGAPLGRIRDVVFDPGSGRLRFVVVALDARGGARLVAARPDALQPPRGDADGRWTLDAGRAELDAAPRVDPAEWPEPGPG
jgi:sporulation protein YlmC with PRC-barrel domain